MPRSDQFMAFVETSEGMRRRSFPRHIRDVPQMFKPELFETSGEAKSSQRIDETWLCRARVCFAIPAGRSSSRLLNARPPNTARGVTKIGTHTEKKLREENVSGPLC